jgi:hypothetical protein
MEHKIISGVVNIDVNGMAILLSEKDQDLAKLPWVLERSTTSDGIRHYVRYAKSKGRLHLVVMKRMLKEQGKILRKDEYVDHINRNPLDNRRENLRVATSSQNNVNKGKIKAVNGKETSSKFKGVSWDKKAQKWKARIKCDGMSTHLGYFDSEEDAARAYDNAAKDRHGEFENLNFPS